MKHVIAVVNQKGGVGKTTISYNLAYEFSIRGRTLLVDADDQASSATLVERWPLSMACPFDLVEATQADEVREAVLSSTADFVVIDGAPERLRRTATGIELGVNDAALEVATLAIVPLQPTSIDLASTLGLCMTSIKRAFEVNPRLSYGVLLNRVKISSGVPRRMMDEIAREGFPTFRTLFTDSTAHHLAAEAALPLRLVKSWNQRLILEDLEGLMREIEEALDLPSQQTPQPKLGRQA